ncbi:PIN domain-containing protein [Nocardiopsis rhodophaea]
MRHIVYDTGALIAAERRAPDMLSLHDEVTGAGLCPIVPVVVLAQAWRGGPQQRLSRLLKGCDIVPDDAAIGRAAGTACGAAGTSDIVDAIVVTTALQSNASIVTSDPDDLNRIAGGVSVKLRLYVV